MSRPSSSASTPIQIVGTPAASVTRSDSISSAIAGGVMCGPGNTSSAPAITAACARPQALAWNIGTTGRTTSRSQTPSVSASIAPMECRTLERCAVDDALRVAGRAARVTHRRGPVLVVDAELGGLGAGDQLLVVEDPVVVRDRRRRRRPSRRRASPSRSRRRAARAREQRAVDEDHLVLGVVDDVGELLGEQADVQRVQDAPGARRGEVQLQVAGAVPGERADAGVGGEAERVERAAEPAGALGPLARRSCAPPVAVTVTIVFSPNSRSARWNACVSVSG